LNDVQGLRGLLGLQWPRHLNSFNRWEHDSKTKLDCKNSTLKGIKTMKMSNTIDNAHGLANAVGGAVAAHRKAFGTGAEQ